MDFKSQLNQWTEAVPSKSRFRNDFQDMHLSVLQHALQQTEEKELLSIVFAQHDFVLFEIKGRPADMTGITLPEAQENMLWLCLQFIGKLTFPNGTVCFPDSFFTFVSAPTEFLLTLPATKIHSLFLGVGKTAQQQLLAEFPRIRQLHEDNNFLSPRRSLTYVERLNLQQFSKQPFGPFTTTHHIGQLYAKLYASYAQQLEKQKPTTQEEASSRLYHDAIEYIRLHYMDADLDRHRIADALNCSTRILSRAFEGRNLKLNTSILLIRLYKGRELLRQNPDLSIDEVAAMLHFPSLSHFSAQYKKYFYRSPREDRKGIDKWKE